MAARPEVGRGRHAEHVLEPFGHAVVDASGAMGRSADGRREALRRAFRQHSRGAAAGEKGKEREPYCAAIVCKRSASKSNASSQLTLCHRLAALADPPERMTQAILVVLLFQARHTIAQIRPAYSGSGKAPALFL